MSDIYIKAGSVRGAYLPGVVEQALFLAKSAGVNVQVEFRGVRLLCKPGVNPKDIIAEYNRLRALSGA